jgi:hypothetical protein
MMGDGSNINNVIKTGSMMDVGTRYQFLAELYDLWESGLDILERYDKHTPGYEEKKNELEIACRLLGYHMQKDYHDEYYKKVIDLLPMRAEDIPPRAEDITDYDSQK